MKRDGQPPGRRWPRQASLLLRVVAAVGGGYACTVALSSTAAQLLTLLGGMARSEAVILAAMLGFILYLVLLLWSFTEPRLWRVWALLLAGTAIGLGLRHQLAPALVGA
ncbi:hypothetical protein [Pseudomonas sp. SST3]|uniref:hypothetical protein n=1 Tax=Pseudomonas sp. SST3 TaxID=2267882 RepID=UPI000DF9477F|nr:hypothetical protein [Pseudomonas sp. SST3]NKQ09653.1 hypothetical protein [Pseudomonas sp. SST3]